MSLDGIVVHALVKQLQPIVNRRIAKIYQPTPNELIFYLRSSSEKRKEQLLLSANPSMPRIHWSTHTWSNPSEPPMFCMLLRKYCEGAIIEKIQQVNLERIVELDIRHQDELGDFAQKRIVIEMMGRHSNIIFLNPVTGVILDGIRHVGTARNTYRLILPGVPYLCPPDQQKKHPFKVTQSQFNEMIPQSQEACEVADRLVAHFMGLGPLIAREIVQKSLEKQCPLWEIFHELIKRVEENQLEPTLITREDGKTFFSIFPLTHIPGKQQPFPDISHLLEIYYQNKASSDLIRQRTADLQHLLNNEIKKSEKKLVKLAETQQKAESADWYRHSGELLTAQQHLVKKGDKKITLIDYYDLNQSQWVIPLDPKLTPNANAQKLFHKYTKLKNSRHVINEQIAKTKAELDYLASVVFSLASAGPKEVAEIKDELVSGRYIREPRPNRKVNPKKKNRPTLLLYLSSEGIRIYVGKNNTQNDYITKKLAKPSDTWLHTKNIPGSHVVIQAKEFGETTLLEAALLAAFYSKAKDASLVAVDYTLVRYVHKPSGAKPGFVIYDKQRTLYVTPTKASVGKLVQEWS